MANPFIHVELGTTNPAEAKAFYAKLFDWKFDDIDVPAGTYTMIDVGDAGRKDGIDGGIMKQLRPRAPSAWLAYVFVEDIKAATARAGVLGAKILKDVDEIPGRGWLSIIEDPTGAALGLWQPQM